MNRNRLQYMICKSDDIGCGDCWLVIDISNWSVVTFKDDAEGFHLFITKGKAEDALEEMLYNTK